MQSENRAAEATKVDATADATAVVLPAIYADRTAVGLPAIYAARAAAGAASAGAVLVHAAAASAGVVLVAKSVARSPAATARAAAGPAGVELLDPFVTPPANALEVVCPAGVASARRLAAQWAEVQSSLRMVPVVYGDGQVHTRPGRTGLKSEIIASPSTPRQGSVAPQCRPRRER